MFRTLLIANRGEIACRIARTARCMGIRTVAVFSDADRDAMHVAAADEAHHVGASPAAESYLRADRILEAARRSGADAIHPGYGFLSENADFAEACAAAGIAFVGPPPAAIRAMGSKAESKRLMVAAGVPTVPGYHGEDQSDALLAAEAARIGFPVLIKASAGGGGKGMRPAFGAEDFADELAGARREARAAFGDDRVLLEKYLQKPRHVEVQVFGDRHGRVVHLHTRDCSVQRRHQKVIEEAPAPFLSDALRQRLHDAAVAAAKAVGYVNAGTVEFIVEGDEAYFLEMNTRLQVEHPVTEMVTGLDLVEWQLRVAAGEPLPEAWPPAPHGHAVEARLYAEDPAEEFRPSTGRLRRLDLPAAEGLRVDAGFRAGDTVTPFYDPMLAKIIAWGEDRRMALGRLAEALAGTGSLGVTMNAPFLRRIATHPAFAAGELDTGFIPRHAAELLAPSEPVADERLALGAAAAFAWRAASAADGPWDRADGFRLQGAATVGETWHDGQRALPVSLRVRGPVIEARAGDAAAHRIAWSVDEGRVWLEARGVRLSIEVEAEGDVVILREGGHRWTQRRLDPYAASGSETASEGRLSSPVPGRVVQVLVRPGDAVEAGQTLLVIEAMKTEIKLRAGRAGHVAIVACAVGDAVSEGVELVRMTAADPQ
jgi:3-methylcrotonyl-CoA carboxylase alpha subunit